MKLSPLALSITFLLTLPSSAFSDVQTDGSTGKVENLSGTMTIPQSLGKTVGSNLFHSFNKFSVNTGESATFTGANALKNVISRVTGGAPSVIDGLLKSTILNADFYFINPAGVTFNAGAQIDVPNGFHVSTANKITFDNGAVFNVDTNAIGSSFGTANPESFGFLGDQSGDIKIQDSQIFFTETTDVSISASNNISIDKGRLFNVGGRIKLYAVGNKNTIIPINKTLLSPLMGKLTINSSTINTSNNISGSTITNNLGDVLLYSGLLKLKNSHIFANNFGNLNGDDKQKGISLFSKNIIMDASSLSITAHSSGNAGNIAVNSEKLSILNGGRISSLTASKGNAGIVTVKSHDLLIDTKGSGEVTGIFSVTNSIGNANNVILDSHQISILNGGQITSSTLSSGHAGTVKIKSSDMLLDGQGNKNITGILSDASANSKGNSGSVIIDSEKLSIVNGGRISNLVFSKGNAGVLTINSHYLLIDGQESKKITGILSDANSIGNAGNVIVNSKKLSISNEGRISSVTFGKGNAGSVRVNTNTLSLVKGGTITTESSSKGQAGIAIVDANELLIDGQNSGIQTGIMSDANSIGNGGSIVVNSKKLSIVNGGRISSLAASKGNAGIITVGSNDLLINAKGNRNATGIFSVTNSTGNAGNIIIDSKKVSILNGGQISNSTLSIGKAGEINIKSNDLRLNGQGSKNATGILSGASLNSIGDAGNIIVESDKLSILNGGRISSLVFSEGDAGVITIDSSELLIDGQESKKITGILSDANSIGNAGNVIVNSKKLSISNEGRISSATFGEGNAGNVKVKSNVLSLVKGGTVTTETSSKGQAGLIIVDADELLINGENDLVVTGITSDANKDSKGDAGTVTIKSHDITLLGNGQVSSETTAKGKARSVKIHTDNLTIKDNSRVSSASLTTESSGKTGNVDIFVNNKLALSNGGKISIENQGSAIDGSSVDDSKINIAANDIEMLNSEISSESSGNVAAGDITLNFSGSLKMDPSFIKTTANTGDGGDIEVIGGDLIYLEDSGFLTSVSGENSNGGNISVTANTLVMETGVIQANAKGGAGGDVDLNVQALIASGNLLTLGGKQIGWQPFEFGLNVIQAASESGLSGDISITAPEIDISGTVSGLNTHALATPDVNNDPCSGNAKNSSSLSYGGKGGIPVDENNDFIPLSPRSPVADMTVSHVDKEGNSLNPTLIKLAASSKKSPCSSL